MNGKTLTRLALVASLAALGGPALAIPEEARDEALLLTVDAGLGIPVSDPERDYLNPGMWAGAGLYHTWSPMLAAGLRAHGGFLTADGTGDDMLGMGLFSLALRARPLAKKDDVRRGTGLWVETGIGLGLLDGPGSDTDARLGFEGAVGWNFEAGPLGVGPFFRVLHFFQRDASDLVAVVIGAEVNLFDHRPEGDKELVAGPPPHVETAPAEPRPSPIVALFIEDRLVVDETVFFDFDKSTLRPEGKSKLDEIVSAWRREGNSWKSLKIMGFADERGPADYNIQLSRDRAQAVAAYLSAHGMPAEKLDTEGYGESHPAVADATTPEEYQRNRRVEFRIER